MRRIVTFISSLIMSGGIALAGSAPGQGNQFILATYWGEDAVALIDINGEPGKEEVWRIDVLKTANCAKPYDIRVNAVTSKAYVSCSGNNLIAVVDVVAQQVESTFVTGRSPRDLQIFDGGKKLIVANSGSNTVTVFDIHDGANAKILDFPVENQPYGVAVLKDKQALVTGWASGDLHIFDMDFAKSPASATARAKIDVGMLPYTVVVPKDSDIAYVAANSIHKVIAVDIVNSKKIAEIQVGSNPWSLAASPDGSNVLVTNNRSSSLSLIKTGASTMSIEGLSNTTTMQAGSQVQSDGVDVLRAPKNASISANGSIGAFTDLANNQIGILDLASGAITKVINVGRAPYGIEFFR